jgi:bifunctional enzyme CysN/CysC
MGRSVTVLYGPEMRQGLCRDLGFTADERSENLRRSSEVAKIINDAGVLCICAFGAPHDAVREKARQAVGAQRCLTAWLNAPVEVCRQRDHSGAYAMADAGKIASFPGVSAVFEEPTHADLILPTHEISVNQSVERIIKEMKDRGFIS